MPPYPLPEAVDSRVPSFVASPPPPEIGNEWHNSNFKAFRNLGAFTQSRVNKPETGRQRVKRRGTKVRNCHVSVHIAKCFNEWFTKAKGSFLFYFYFYLNKPWHYQLLLDKNNVILSAMINTTTGRFCNPDSSGPQPPIPHHSSLPVLPF